MRSNVAGVAAVPRPAVGGIGIPASARLALARFGWALLSVAMFAGIWEALWALGVADEKLLPPPHIFLGNIPDQARFFNTATRWQIGVNPADGPSPYEAVFITIGATSMRVFVGLLIAALLSISIGVLIRYVGILEKLVLPTITLLSPVSPIAWLPVAIFIFGIGNAPAIFMVVVALFFHMVLSTISQIDSVNRNFINVARTMGASSKRRVPSGRATILSTIMLTVWLSMGRPVAGE
jgi:NitT/TauT family transport system permease protein